MTKILVKKLLYQSKNRGCRETDIILGQFAEQYLSSMSEIELKEYERILQLQDVDIYDWVTKKKSLPATELASPVMRKLLNFKFWS